MFCENGGCMAKLSGIDLTELIYKAQKRVFCDSANETDKNLEFEDCAITSLNEGDYLFSTDFAPLVGDDYFVAGKIAALNAISDIYAMGGIPLFALIILVIGDEMTSYDQEELLSGLYAICKKENIIILGGHTIKNEKPMAGMTVIGKTQGDKVFRKKGAIAGDKIWITKKLGSGLAIRSYANGLITRKAYESVVDCMLISNKLDDVILEDQIHAITDITGYGFLGHLSEMLDSKTGAKIYRDRVPVMNAIMNVLPYALMTDYISNNYHYANSFHKCDVLMFDNIVDFALCDPQTNGGLIIISDKDVSLEKYGYFLLGEIIDTPQVIISDDY